MLKWIIDMLDNLLSSILSLFSGGDITLEPTTPINTTLVTPIIPFTPEPIKVSIKPVTPIKPVSLYPTIQNFLDKLPDCEWCSACGSYARYTRLEAEKQGLNISEITVLDDDRSRIQQTTMNGHRINYFYNGNRRVYIDNMYNWKLIIEGENLKQHIKDKFGFDLERITYKKITIYSYDDYIK